MSSDLRAAVEGLDVVWGLTANYVYRGEVLALIPEGAVLVTEADMLRILPDVLSWATEQDSTYGYSDEPGSPYVRILAAAILRHLREGT